MSNAVNDLLNKLKAFKDNLSEDEQQAFGGMVELAAKTAEELSNEDLARAGGAALLRPTLLIAKTQSEHAGLIAKTQSSHIVLPALTVDRFNLLK
jgi:hypothetical protein